MSVEISATLKGGPGYDAPWLVVRVDSDNNAIVTVPDPDKDGKVKEVHVAVKEAVAQLDETLSMLRELDAFGAVQVIATEFKGAPKDAAAVIKAAFPGATEVKDTTPAPRPAATPASPVQQGIPACSHCGRPRKFRDGISPKTGKWAGYFCESGDKTHTEWLPV